MVSLASTQSGKVLYERGDAPEGVRVGFKTRDAVGKVVVLGRDVGDVVSNRVVEH